MIIQRYLIKEISINFLAVASVLLVVFMSHRFARMLAEAASGKIPGEIVFMLLGLNAMTALVILVPVSLFIGILVAMGRLYKDSEVTAMTACGLSELDLLKPILILAFVLSMFVAYLSMFLTPWAIQQGEEFKADALSSSLESQLIPGQFRTMGNKNRVVYFKNYNSRSKEMESIYIVDKTKSEQVLITAKSGRLLKDSHSLDGFLVLNNGFRYHGRAGRADYQIIQFRFHKLRIHAKKIEPKIRLKSTSSSTLWNSDSVMDKMELQWRISMPIGLMILALLALPLSYTTPRQGRFAKLFYALVVYILYYNLLGIARSTAEQNVIPSWLGLWWVHLVFLSVGLFVLIRNHRPDLLSKKATT